MIWLAWRQQRLTVLATLALGAVAAAGMLALRFAATSYMADHGIAGCDAPGPGCDFTVMNQFSEAFRGFQTPIIFLMFALPPLIGAFTGGPLFAREIERGTHVFALTQSVGRIRWWAAKAAVGLVPLLVVTLALGLVATWVAEPLSYLTPSPIRSPGFETQGTVMAAYTVLAFAVGATAGLLTRNTLGAMVVTIVLYIVLLVVVGSFLREHYAEPLSTTDAIRAQDREPAYSDAWQVDYEYRDAAGEEVDFQITPGCADPDECLREEGVTEVYMAFHPADRFWRFQLTESALFGGVAVLFLAAGAWAVRRVRS